MLEELPGAVAEDRAQAVVVRRAAGVQAEVQTHHDGRQFVPEVLLTLMGRDEACETGMLADCYVTLRVGCLSTLHNTQGKGPYVSQKPV